MSRRRGFTLIELLVVVAIIALLVAILLPALARARQSARTVACSGQVREVFVGLTFYVGDWNNMLFWRGENLALDGMDWYVYGGRPTGNLNTGQDGIFNRYDPRPLNPYVSDTIDLFRCPEDNVPLEWSDDHPHFEWVGNSYNFNSNGTHLPTEEYQGGLAGVNMTHIYEPTMTILFYDASVTHYHATEDPDIWHGGVHNVAMVDGHVEQVKLFDLIPDEEGSSRYRWSIDYEESEPEPE